VETGRRHLSSGQSLGETGLLEVNSSKPPPARNILQDTPPRRGLSVCSTSRVQLAGTAALAIPWGLVGEDGSCWGP
jgi:hypothetical protein